jgi:hypothetical protein
MLLIKLVFLWCEILKIQLVVDDYYFKIVFFSIKNLEINKSIDQIILISNSYREKKKQFIKFYVLLHSIIIHLTALFFSSYFQYCISNVTEN